MADESNTASPAPDHPSGVCVFCGCTDENCDRCIAKTGRPCFWANAARTFCSACLFLLFKELIVDNPPLV